MASPAPVKRRGAKGVTRALPMCSFSPHRLSPQETRSHEAIQDIPTLLRFANRSPALDKDAWLLSRARILLSHFHLLLSTAARTFIVLELDDTLGPAPALCGVACRQDFLARRNKLPPDLRWTLWLALPETRDRRVPLLRVALSTEVALPVRASPMFTVTHAFTASLANAIVQAARAAGKPSITARIQGNTDPSTDPNTHEFVERFIWDDTSCTS